MQLTIKPKKLHTVPEVPGDKSWIIRYILISALRGESCVVENINLCEDVLAAQRCTAEFGSELHCGESATVLRLLLPSMIARYGAADFICEGNLIHRPMDVYNELFRLRIEGNRLHAEGELKREYSFKSTISSQFVSGLLIAGCEVNAPSVSSPYISMTKTVLNAPCPGRVTVPEDRTLKAFFQIGNLIIGDADDDPDLVPCWALQAAVGEGETVIPRVGRLRHKECDRVNAITEILSALGAEIRQTEDTLTIRARPFLSGGVAIDPRGDHRMAMMAAAASQFCEKPVLLKNAQCVRKSYPAFFDDFVRCGGEIDVFH